MVHRIYIKVQRKPLQFWCWSGAFAPECLDRFEISLCLYTAIHNPAYSLSQTWFTWFYTYMPIILDHETLLQSKLSWERFQQRTEALLRVLLWERPVNETGRCQAFEVIFLELLSRVREKVRELTSHNRWKEKAEKAALVLRQTQLHINKGMKTTEYSKRFF